jgi:aspartyl-tRNA(Asn)/glutamyl-tRNA(Gln) amidotransferase subunit C
MAITRAEVLKIAELANLHVPQAEIDAFTEQFQRILEYVEKLRAVDTSGVEPTSHVVVPSGRDPQPLRADRVGVSLPADEALGNAPDPGQGQFKVPKVL